MTYQHKARLWALSWLLAGMAGAASASEARFSAFSYAGEKPEAPLPKGTYRNPILPGFYPDPSITRVGRDFYLTTSTFGFFPALPVFHSRDLVHWRPIGHAITREGDLPLRGVAIGQGIYAPDISYHNGLFHIVSTCVECGGNFLITARNPAGPWSKPRWITDAEGFDPSLFFDDDGTAWLVNHAAPQGGARYKGHGAIWLRPFDVAQGKALGPARMIVEGGLEPEKNPLWIEGPHIFKRNGRYYLTLAEGGTGVGHSQVIFAADRVEGPWTPAPLDRQPILTQRDLPADRPAPVMAAGHADLVDVGGDRWWAVFLATRPYAGELYSTGRETFLLPVTWRDGWPRITAPGQAIGATARAPALPPAPRGAMDAARPQTGFAGPEWVALRGAAQGWVKRAGQGAVLTARGDDLAGTGRPAFLARRLQHADGAVETTMHFVPASGEAAGLAAFHDENSFVTLTLTLTQTGQGARMELRRRGSAQEDRRGILLASAPVSAKGKWTLRMAWHGGALRASIAPENGAWRDLGDAVDIRMFSPKPGSFIGTMVGLYAVSGGE